MNRDQYIEALTLCFKAESAGAIAGEVAMLLREDHEERRKLDIFRRLEAGNRELCLDALAREGAARPEVESSLYRGGYKLGLQLGHGDWNEFLDRFEWTVHPEVFKQSLLDENGEEIAHEYSGVDVELLRHLVRHELSFVEFLSLERQGRGNESIRAMQCVLDSELFSTRFGPDDPVGW